MPITKGSSGMEIPIPKNRFSMLIEMGTRKTKIIITRSNLSKDNKASAANAGNAGVQ